MNFFNFITRWFKKDPKINPIAVPAQTGATAEEVLISRGFDPSTAMLKCAECGHLNLWHKDNFGVSFCLGDNMLCACLKFKEKKEEIKK